jgi:hypothetical protein
MGSARPLPPEQPVQRTEEWDSERSQLLGRRISELGLAIRGTRVEQLTSRLYEELDALGVAFRPPVYLSDQWGCPDGSPIIGVPFYLADDRLERIEAEHAGAIESDDEAMRYLRHEAGHAVNYAFRLHERADFNTVFGDYARPYREHYAADPLSRAHVRHILGWYAQKHPDEISPKTFAVWMTPGLDWRAEYADWSAIDKLEWVDAVMREVGAQVPTIPELTDDDLPVESMHWTVAEHYESDEELRVWRCAAIRRRLATDLRAHRRCTRRRSGTRLSHATRGRIGRAPFVLGGRRTRRPCAPSFAHSRSARRRSNCASPGSMPRRSSSSQHLERPYSCTGGTRASSTRLLIRRPMNVHTPARR